MRRLLVFRNKYVFTITLFVVYILFLDDVDIFKIVRQEVKLSKLKTEQLEIQQKYEETKTLLNELEDDRALERYAREKKFFKHDDEDIFVIVYE